MINMKIGIFTETFLPQVNGVVTSMCNINRVLMKKGHEVSIFTVGEGPTEIDGYKVHRFRGATFKPYPEYSFLLPDHSQWAFLVKQPLDIIHSRTPFPLGVMAKQLSKKLEIPIVGTFDTPISDYIHYVPILGSIQPTKYILSNIAKKWLRYYYGMCDVLTVPSETTKQRLVKEGFEVDIEVVSNGVDTKKFNTKNFDKALKKSICANDELFILHVGRITKEKNVVFLVKTVEKILKKRKLKLVIAGSGPLLPKLKHYVSSKNLSENILFTGYLTQEELQKYYATADLFLTASTVETQGIVLLESMSSGTPVIGVDKGAIPELVKDSYNGFLFGENDIEKLTSLIENYSKNRSLSQNCIKTVETHTIESVGNQVERLYKQVINK